MVVTLQEETVNGRLKPVLEGARVTPNADNWYDAHFKKGWYHLKRTGPGEYLAFAVGEVPALEGTEWAEYRQTADFSRWPDWKIDGDVPNPEGPGTRSVTGLRIRLEGQLPPQAASQANPWRIRGMTITRAVPTLSSVIGSVNIEEVETP